MRIYLSLEDGDTVYRLDSLHKEVSQCEGRPAQPQTHRSPEPGQQVHLLHDVVLLQDCKIANSILDLGS